MLIIRYRRIGKRNHSQFKIVVAEKSFSVSGKFIEALGSYDPHSKEVALKEDRINYWLGVGAQCSDSVYNLFISKGIIKGKKRKVNIKKSAETEKADNLNEQKEAPIVVDNQKEDLTKNSQEENKEETEKIVQPDVEAVKEETKEEDKKE